MRAKRFESLLPSSHSSIMARWRQRSGGEVSQPRSVIPPSLTCEFLFFLPSFLPSFRLASPPPSSPPPPTRHIASSSLASSSSHPPPLSCQCSVMRGIVGGGGAKTSIATLFCPRICHCDTRINNYSINRSGSVTISL